MIYAENITIKKMIEKKIQDVNLLLKRYDTTYISLS